jgi:hypothetical protein
VTTRLRRGADSLLVVSGTVDQQINAEPARLADVIDAALLEIEGYEKVEIVEPIPDVAVSAELATCAFCWPNSLRTPRTSPHPAHRCASV